MLRSSEIVRFIRFVAVGVLNSAFGYGLYAILIHMGIIPEIALLVATVLGVIFNFSTTGRLVFRSSDNRLFFKFVAAYAVIYVCNAMALRILVNFGIDPFAAQAVLMPLSVIATFAMMRAFVFREASK
ncbi:GtrA family protein [Rhizobium sp. RHZ02]|uniref:GtrA family protein n=1 Tax=Rhizobium sp. RHZ02 TaxID=2769306 RepID=UPI001AEED46D|nr:GtrA family protein [Rhizobium sp. RHZ02]